VTFQPQEAQPEGSKLVTFEHAFTADLQKGRANVIGWEASQGAFHR
jgi:hypothetical protein